MSCKGFKIANCQYGPVMLHKWQAYCLFLALPGMAKAVSECDEVSLKWRPSYHLQAPKGWMGAPAAIWYDEPPGRYHLFYLWNRKGTAPTDISWGHASSYNLVRWMHHCRPELPAQTLSAQSNLSLGYLLEGGPNGEPDKLTLLYTSSPSVASDSGASSGSRESALLNMATSNDLGLHWQFSGTSTLPGPPKHLNVTTRRDPFVEKQPGLNQALQHPADGDLFALMSGGIRNQGPQAFLYRVSSIDLTNWTYVGAVADLHAWKPSRWLPDVGTSWEAGNLFELDGFDFLIAGAEGIKRQPNITGRDGRPLRTPKSLVWLTGELKASEACNCQASLTPQIGGILDNGTFYAARSLYDPIAKRRLVWGWIPDEDITPWRHANQGWAGVISLPRHIFLTTVRNVVSGLNLPIHELHPGAFLSKSDNSPAHVTTLGIAPLAELTKLRHPLRYVSEMKLSGEYLQRIVGARSKSFELTAHVTFVGDVEAVGFVVRHTEDDVERTRIMLRPKDNLLLIDRSESTTLSDVNVDADYGPFTLFRVLANDASADVVDEPWRVQIFCDNSVIEVFANDRFALSSRIYPNSPDALSMSAFLSGGREGQTEAIFRELTVWSLEAR